MKKLLCLILLTFCFKHYADASPLLFKMVKTVDTDTQLDLAIFDATRYRQIRIGIQILDSDSSYCDKGSPAIQNIQLESQLSMANIELNAARREWARNDELLQKGVISQAFMDESKDRLECAKKSVADLTARVEQNKSRPLLKYPCSSLRIFGGNGTDMMGHFGDISASQIGARFFVIDSPPTSIRFAAFGKGKYAIYIWGQ